MTGNHCGGEILRVVSAYSAENTWKILPSTVMFSRYFQHPKIVTLLVISSNEVLRFLNHDQTLK